MDENSARRQADISLSSRSDEYSTLVTLWSGGTRDYHSLFSAYLSANAIFVAAGMVVMSRFGANEQFVGFLLLVISLVGLIVALQMLVALARFSGQNAFFEWRLRSIERHNTVIPFKLFSELWQWRETAKTIEDPNGFPDSFKPNCAVYVHRCFFFRRSKVLPFVFIVVYVLFLGFSIHYLCQCGLPPTPVPPVSRDRLSSWLVAPSRSRGSDDASKDALAPAAEPVHHHGTALAFGTPASYEAAVRWEPEEVKGLPLYFVQRREHPR